MSTPKHAHEMDREGKCIICGKSGVKRIRGLCPAHHTRFVKKMRSVPPDDRAEFERLMISRGHVLPDNQGKRGGPEDDTFDKDWADYLAMKSSGDPPDPKIFEEAARKAAAAAASQDTKSIASPLASTPAAAAKGKRSRSK